MHRFPGRRPLVGGPRFYQAPCRRPRQTRCARGPSPLKCRTFLPYPSPAGSLPCNPPP
ncbi:uncharacterized protein AruCF_4571 [Achromobacter ruhlandii]|nr:uncharacterized protein AruCF_4571 [Achromobacter ruhlandii]